MSTIRPATPADLPQITALDQEIFGTYGAAEDPAIIQARLEVFPEGCVVLEESGEDDGSSILLGYLTTEKWTWLREPALDENPHQTHTPHGRVLNVTTLAIAPAHQNRGLGKHLLDHAFCIASREGCTQIVLETARARQFYLRHGFKVIGKRSQRGVQLYIMLSVVEPEAAARTKKSRTP